MPSRPASSARSCPRRPAPQTLSASPRPFADPRNREGNHMTNSANDVLVETDWLAQHAKDPNVRLFEVDVDTSAYDQGHVSGAIGLNWKTDLQQHPVRDLIDKKQLETLLSKHGVTTGTTVVAYGDNSNWFAAWFFWLLKYYGHKDAKLVNGGRAKWVAEGRPLSNATPSFDRSDYKAKSPDASVRALRDLVLERVTDGKAKIVDVRSPK